jgi:hypothetical protein
LAKIDYKRTVFTSVTVDGNEIVTMDDFGIADLSGIRAIEVVYRSDFDELFVRHAQRMVETGKPLKSFSPLRALDEYEDLARVRAEKMVSMGLAKYLEISESNWRYTVKGAFVNAFISYVKGMQKANEQKSRRHKRRPGS